MSFILSSSSDHVGKGFLVVGLHTSVVSPVFIFFHRGKTKQKNATANDENIMQTSIWNAHYMCRSMQEGIRSFRSMVRSFQVRSFQSVVRSFHKIVSSFHKIVTSFHMYAFAHLFEVALDESKRMPKN